MSYDPEADSNDTHVPTIIAFSTTLEVPPAHLFESDDPEPDECELNEFDSPKNTPARATPFCNTVLNNLQYSPLASRFSKLSYIYTLTNFVTWFDYITHKSRSSSILSFTYHTYR